MQQITQLNPTNQSPLIPKSHFSLKWGKRRTGFNRTRRFTNNIILNSITAVASTLKILPEPWDTLLKEFWVVSSGGGNGGKFWFKNRFGDSGDNGGRGNRGEKSGFLVRVILVISTGLAMWAVLEKERVSGGNLGIWVVGILIGWCLRGREIRYWVLGFCCGAALMGSGLKRNNGDLVKWVDGFKDSILPNFGIVCGKKRRVRSFGRWI